MKKNILYHTRVQKLQAFLKKDGCNGLIVDDPINLFYLTGLSLSSGKLVIHPKGAHLIIDGRYVELCKKSSPFPTILAENNHTLIDLLALPELEALNCLAIDPDNITYGNYLQLEKELERLKKENGKVITLKTVGNTLGELRGIKDNSEISLLREAAHLGSQGFDYVCTLLKEGITEAEVAAELEIFWKRKGSKSLAFDPIIAFGANGSMPHYRPGNAKLQKGQSVLIDIGVNLEHYHSDMTRVVFFGTPDPKILAIYAIVQEAQQAALALCKPGTLIGALDAAARDLIKKRGYGENFTHSLGHGVGLEIHESPTLRNKSPYKEVSLQNGMVITIEPGIYLPGIGGVRLEDTVVITDSGYENLTNRPVEPMIITP